MRKIANIFWLGTKELRSFLHDYVLLGLVVYAFSLAIIAQAQSNSQELHNASIGIRRRGSFRAVAPDRACVPAALFPGAAADRRARHRAADERGQVHLRGRHSAEFRARCPRRTPARDSGRRRRDRDGAGGARVRLCAADHHHRDRRLLSRAGGTRRCRRSISTCASPSIPNVTTAWFTSVMGIINNVTMLAIILAGAAIVREREHGTMDHLLVMPLTPFEIAMSKVWANGLVITRGGRPFALPRRARDCSAFRSPARYHCSWSAW